MVSFGAASSQFCGSSSSVASSAVFVLTCTTGTYIGIAEILLLERVPHPDSKNMFVPACCLLKVRADVLDTNICAGVLAQSSHFLCCLADLKVQLIIGKQFD